MIETKNCNREAITNNDKTLEIISEKEIDKYINSMTRNEMIISFSVLEDALKIFESLGCGYHDIKLISYYCLSDKGLLTNVSNWKVWNKTERETEERETEEIKDMEQRGEYEMIMEEDLKESINKHIELIKNLSSLSNVQLITFVNILSINNPEMFNKLREITKWESKVLSEFMKESGQTNEKKKKEPKKKPKEELKRASEDMFEQSQYDRVQIGGEK